MQIFVLFFSLCSINVYYCMFILLLLGAEFLLGLAAIGEGVWILLGLMLGDEMVVLICEIYTSISSILNIQLSSLGS